jgi:bifunctional non-homologous end joining protein LigD
MKYCLVQDLATLVWCANLADIELHTSLSQAADILRPTMMVFDLDPGEPADIVQCCQVGLWVRAIFDRLGLKSFAKTSGSKGLQVYVPLNTAVTYDETKLFAHELARALERQHPDMVVSEMKKNLRGGKIFVDWSQNDDHKTTVCVYSLRAKAQPTVSAPVKWEEVERCLRKEDPGLLSFNSDQVLSRSEQAGDLFAPVLKLRQALPAIEELRKQPAAGEPVRPSPNLRAPSKKSASAGERRSGVSEQLTPAGKHAPSAGSLQSVSKGRKNTKPQGGSTTSKRRPA